MFRTLLVPHDGSATGDAILPVARTIARVMGGDIVLLRVVPEAPAGAHLVQLEHALEALERVRLEVAAPDVTVRTLVRCGEPAEQILAAAASEGADLIAMATYGFAGIDRLLVGSVAEGVLAHSAAPVLLTRPGAHHVRRLRGILVPTDGTPGAALALAAALPLANSSGASLTLLRVSKPVRAWEYHADQAGELGREVQVGQAVEEAGRVRAEDFVRAIADRLVASGYRATGIARAGAPAAEIVEAARELDADLIVMSTHARTGPVRAILGSVADAVVHAADRPVLLIPHADGLTQPTTRAVVTSARHGV